MKIPKRNASAAGNGRGAKQIYNPAGLQLHFNAETTRFANNRPAEFIHQMAQSLADEMTVFGNWPRESS